MSRDFGFKLGPFAASLSFKIDYGNYFYLPAYQSYGKKMCILNFQNVKKNGEILFSGVRQILDSGVVEDQRGFNVKWKAKLQGNKIVGVFEQPFDSGKFILHEAYVK